MNEGDNGQEYGTKPKVSKVSMGSKIIIMMLSVLTMAFLFSDVDETIVLSLKEKGHLNSRISAMEKSVSRLEAEAGAAREAIFRISENQNKLVSNLSKEFTGMRAWMRVTEEAQLFLNGNRWDAAKSNAVRKLTSNVAPQPQAERK